MLMPAPMEAARTDNEGIPTIAGCERSGEDGRERRDRAVHQAGKAQLNNLQNKQTAVGFLFFGLDAGGELFFFELIGTLFVAALLVGQVVQELPNAGVLRTPSSLLVETARLKFDGAGLPSNGIQPERAHQPDGLALNESAHVLAADERDVLAEFFLVQLNQTPAMPGLLVPHAFAYSG